MSSRPLFGIGEEEEREINNREVTEDNRFELVIYRVPVPLDTLHQVLQIVRPVPPPPVSHPVFLVYFE